ncbi:MAG: biopolymer transporter ExbD [Candidatus Thiodiazotropha lotti]|uniref:Biopolymer transporter n=1 Tax=Candidatus Thiodiazotropha endoloripes TaxID=1818881 RepID=A0A1E2UT33_9GAMM|nr:biopolymer transporter ExbD [Candidatus Thiodiazotropha endoloripes]MCG7898067.1 biopolymer transporter ExbD [Candidatus Thiodiazotropha weberae]MCG7990545.1 biopolymer transporter ExbD [Candidatus Thiodiazotropha lotti]MCG7901583.1 biopolymer transporter ExbD [Candidatus Thiodiazotropha weberae]MCG7913817.1 biopolymer transporter ExbD [Candidatus Thiodiazotropha weberae]MCG7999922.1 biopolymer transporter ExbD [Candidatus Thiodiazotropha lotti]
MNFRTKARKSPEVDITPLIDVVFLLLIFFMVSTTFEHESQILIELPEATGEEIQREKQQLDITINIAGTFFVDQREVVNTEMETLKMAISKAIGDRGNIPVIINADARTPHQSVMTAMDAASQLGLTKMTFSAHKPALE